MGPGSYIRCPMSDKRERASIASPITQANGVRTLPHRGTHPARMGRNSIARGAAPGGKMPLRIVCFLPQAPSGRHTGREQWHRRRTDFTSSPSGQCRDTACRPGGALHLIRSWYLCVTPTRQGLRPWLLPPVLPGRHPAIKFNRGDPAFPLGFRPLIGIGDCAYLIGYLETSLVLLSMGSGT